MYISTYRLPRTRFPQDCPTSWLKWSNSDYNTSLILSCSVHAILATERDFRDQKGRLREELLFAVGRGVIFYPKFHYELSFFGAVLVYGQVLCTGELTVQHTESP